MMCLGKQLYADADAVAVGQVLSRNNGSAADAEKKTRVNCELQEQAVSNLTRLT
jgi:hypothetical protein